MKPILPSAKLGVLGGGQLGRMFVMAARTLGYETAVYDPDPESPAGKLADHHFCAGFDETQTLDEFAALCAAVTIEFENVPIAALKQIRKTLKRSPDPGVIEILQDRCREKNFLRKTNIATVDFCAIERRQDLDAAKALIQAGAILKTARFGYDGKGQLEVADLKRAHDAFLELGERPCILEKKVDLNCELSVVVVRSESGKIASYPVAQNEHKDGILHTSRVPAACSQKLLLQACQYGCRIVEQLDYCGVLAVEFFVTQDQTLLVNEIAPRPHNSGHYTINACSVSQFEQQVRTMCGFLPGETRLLSPVVMVNLLGDVWKAPEIEPDWELVLSQTNTHLHLYGKSKCTGRRKMGHYCVLDQNIDLAEQQARAIYQQLWVAANGTG